MPTSPRPVHAITSGHLDHSRMTNLLGYHLAQASIPTNTVFKNSIGATLQLNKLEFTIVMLLASNEGVTPKRLATALNIPAPNLTLILDRLEKRELILRERSETDRRVQHVSLTRKGIAMARKLETVSASMEQDLLGHLTEAERAMLFELLSKVAKHRRG